MAEGEKPYRLYRGGRAKGKVPLEKRTRPAPRPATKRDARTPRAPRLRRPRRLWLWAGVALVGLLVLLVVWSLLGYLSFARGVSDANERLPDAVERQLDEQTGSLLSDPTTILVIGTDGGRAPGRQGAQRSDSLLVMRTDPKTHRLSYLSIPRDLRVEIPDHGTSKVNSANQLGGPALTIRTVRSLTGLPINHVVVVDFDGFKELIDALGGIEVDVPRRILSNRFDCPYSRERCRTWEGWRFAKGEQRMDGRRALVYSRIRTNRLDASDTDVSRVGRQQAVAEAVGDKITSLGTFLRLPFVGDSLAAPLATDLSAGELARLGWVRFRADTSRSLHCRLGGDPSTSGGEAVLLGSERNVEIVSMFLRRTAPLPPPKGQIFAPGCTRRPR